MYVCMYVKTSEIATCSEKTENQAINAFCDSDKGAFPAPSFVLLTTKPPTPVFPLAAMDRT